MTDTEPSAGKVNESDLGELKLRLARAHRILAGGELWPLTKGHVSSRVPGRDEILVLSHIHAHGRTLDTTVAEDICTIDYDGTWVGGEVEPVGELYMHTSILGARPEFTSVVHTHSVYATALGVAGVNILPVGRRGAPFWPHVPICEFDGQIDTRERGRVLVDALGEGCAVVLKNHGTVVAADSVENAANLAFALEETAQMQWISSGVGTPVGMSRAEAARTMSTERRSEYFTFTWQYYAAKDPRPELDDPGTS